MAAIKQRLEGITGGELLSPLLILFAIYFFDEFDTAGFGVLAPQIKRAFHLTDRAFIGLVIINLTVLFILVIPIGYYGDRLPRTKIVVASALVAGTFSLVTGLAPTL